MNIANHYSINAEIPGFIYEASKDVLKDAKRLKEQYPTQKRYISTDKEALAAIDAAYKTASGLSVQGKIITDSIYKMSKLDIALLIASADKTAHGISRAAYELARDAYITGNVEGKAEALATATSTSKEECLALIEEKLNRVRAKLKKHMYSLPMLYEDLWSETDHSAEEILKLIIARPGRYLAKAPTGFGKTSLIIEPLIRDSFAKGLKVLIISHRRSINATIATGIDGVVSYSDCTHPSVIKEAKGLKIVANSLSASKFEDFIKEADVVIIDEATQVISHVLGGEVKNREKVWNVLNGLSKSAKTMLLTDADINQACVDLVGVDHRFFNVDRDHSDITVSTTTADTARALALESISLGKKTLIACDIAKEALALAKQAEKAGVKALVITAENARWKEQAAFIANPNMTDHDVVIYSPVITSSLSITSGHFEAHFGIFAGQVVPGDAIQMLRRDRRAKSFTVGIKRPDFQKSEIVEVSFHSHTLELIEAIRASSMTQQEKDEVLSKIDFDNKKTEFEAARYRHLSSETWLKDNIMSTLPATMLEQGFAINVLADDAELDKVGYEANRLGRKAVKREVIQDLLDAKAASEAVVKAVDAAGSADNTELMSVVRKQAQVGMKAAELSKADARLWGMGGGAGKIKLFSAMMCLAETAPESDQVVLGALKTAIEKMASVIEDVKWTSQDSVKLFDLLNARRSTAIRLGFIMTSAGTDKGKQSAITRLLGQMGLRTKRKDGGKDGYYYIVLPASLERMAGYIAIDSIGD